MCIRDRHSTYELLAREDAVSWILTVGPIEITNSQGYRQLVTASEADVQVNYEASEEDD